MISDYGSALGYIEDFNWSFPGVIQFDTVYTSGVVVEDSYAFKQRLDTDVRNRIELDSFLKNETVQSPKSFRVVDARTHVYSDPTAKLWWYHDFEIAAPARFSNMRGGAMISLWIDIDVVGYQTRDHSEAYSGKGASATIGVQDYLSDALVTASNITQTGSGFLNAVWNILGYYVPGGDRIYIKWEVPASYATQKSPVDFRYKLGVRWSTYYFGLGLSMAIPEYIGPPGWENDGRQAAKVEPLLPL